MYEIEKFNLGRDALKRVIQIFGIQKMHIPYYLCNVVRHTLVMEHCKPLFYHIDDNFYPDEEFSNEDYILYPNYWGICTKNVQKLTTIYPNLIVDNAHAFFDNPQGLACFNAGHKFGFKESVLWLKKNNKEELFNNCSSVDIIEKRKKIFLELNEKYRNSNLIDIDINSNPFVYPYLADTTENADNLVKELKKEGKTIYRYWSPLPKSYNEYKFYSRLVPIPILPY